MRYVTRTIKMAVVEYEYLNRSTKEVATNIYTCRDNNENKIRKELSKMLEKNDCVFVSIVEITRKNVKFRMDEEKFIAMAEEEYVK